MDLSRVAFDDFVVGSSARLMRAAVVLTGDRPAAEDLLQEVLERVFVAWPRLDDPYAYARRALVNRANNRWRTRRRRPEVPVAELPERPADSEGSFDDRDQLVRALATLPARQRAVVVLRHLEALSESETATVLSCSVGTVKSQNARALARLREVLEGTSDESAGRCGGAA